MNNNLIQYFENINKTNRLSHAFLICNNNFDNLKDELFSILSDYFFNGKKVSEDLDDIIVIRPVNNKIIKEDILNIQEKFRTKSINNSKRVYIIDKAEKLNDYAANSLLKFLEEPQDDIYAFLFSENIDNVFLTIKSRCQVIRLEGIHEFNINEDDEIYMEKTMKLIITLENKKEKSFGYINEFFSKKEEKDSIIKIIRFLKYSYIDLLNLKINKPLQYYNKYIEELKNICDNISEEKIVNKIIVINKLENMLEYNLNINLFIDRLVLELEMV